MHSKSLVIRAVKVVLASSFLLLAIRQVIQNWGSVRGHEWNIQIFSLSLSLFFQQFAFLIFAKSWCLVSNAYGFSVPVKYGFKISYFANLARYIPGKIWPIFGMLIMLRKLGMGKEVAFGTWITATILGLPPALLIGVITVYVFPMMLDVASLGFLNKVSGLSVLLIFAVTVVSLLIPRSTVILYNLVIRLARRQPVPFKLTLRQSVLIALSYCCAWLCFGISFLLLIKGIAQDLSPAPIALIGAFITAYVVGYLAVFSPGGIGPRELVLAGMLAPFVGPIAPGLAVAARIWNIINEIIAAVIAWMIKLEDKEAPGEIETKA